MKNIAIAFIVSFCVCSLIFIWIEKGQRTFNAYNTEQLDRVINDSSYNDILYLGSSRTQMHLNPKIIDSITGLSSLNLGRSGGNSKEEYMLLMAYLTNHKTPKYIFYGIDQRAVDSSNIIPNAIIYLNYLNNKQIVEGLKETYSNIEILKYVPFTRFLLYDDYYRHISIQGNLGKTARLPGREYFKGYASAGDDKVKIPVGKWDELDTTINFELIGQKLRTELVKKTPGNPPLLDSYNHKFLINFQKIINVCKKNKIQLIFYTSPFADRQDIFKEKDIRLLKEIVEFNQMPFFRLDTCKIYTPNDFTDFSHLTHKGSRKNSQNFGLLLKALLK
jgi:hypothetical protein